MVVSASQVSLSDGRRIWYVGLHNPFWCHIHPVQDLTEKEIKEYLGENFYKNLIQERKKRILIGRRWIGIGEIICNNENIHQSLADLRTFYKILCFDEEKITLQKLWKDNVFDEVFVERRVCEKHWRAIEHDEIEKYLKYGKKLACSMFNVWLPEGTKVCNHLEKIKYKIIKIEKEKIILKRSFWKGKLTITREEFEKSYTNFQNFKNNRNTKGLFERIYLFFFG